jgi:Zn-dependent alcohol dehydrogenase
METPPMKIKAAVMYEQGLPSPYVESNPLVIETVDLAGPEDGEVLVEVVAAGLCHSDLAQVAGLRKRRLPVVCGHEGAGIVREVGRGVNTLKPGDHVVMTVASGCGHCRPCLAGKPALCDSMTASRSQGMLPNGRSKLSLDGKELCHYSGISSFAEYAVTMPGALIKIDPAIPLDVAAMFGCAVLTGAGSVLNAAKARPGQHIAVIGLGGVGLNAVMAARIVGASTIIGIDINEGKFALARDLGCTHTFLATDGDLVEKIRDLTRGGVDFVIEVTGARPALRTAHAITCKGGEIICVGLGASDELIEYTHAQLVGQERSVRGCFMGSCQAERDIEIYSQLFLSGQMPIDRLQSDKIGFDQLNLSLDQLHRGEVVRQILMPHA